MQHGIIKRERVLLDGAAAEPRNTSRLAGAPACGKRSVRLVEHEGSARAIEFTCTCGETTLVELAFDEAAHAGDPALNGKESGNKS